MEKLEYGEIVVRNGVRLRYLGNGNFETEGDPLEKRFYTVDGPLTASVAASMDAISDLARGCP